MKPLLQETLNLEPRRWSLIIITLLALIKSLVPLASRIIDNNRVPLLFVDSGILLGLSLLHYLIQAQVYLFVTLGIISYK